LIVQLQQLSRVVVGAAIHLQHSATPPFYAGLKCSSAATFFVAPQHEWNL